MARVYSNGKFAPFEKLYFFTRTCTWTNPYCNHIAILLHQKFLLALVEPRANTVEASGTTVVVQFMSFGREQ